MTEKEMGDVENGKRGWPRWVIGGGACALVLYVGSFLLIVLDEVVLESNWLMDVIPSEAHEPISKFYFPLIWIYELIVE